MVASKSITLRAINPPDQAQLKNALFAGSGGAEHWAVIASLIETRKLNDADPLNYHRRPHQDRQWPSKQPDRSAPALLIVVKNSKPWLEDDAYFVLSRAATDANVTPSANPQARGARPEPS